MRLEPDEGKLSSPVLRGGSGGNVASLPDLAACLIKERRLLTSLIILRCLSLLDFSFNDITASLMGLKENPV